ncbi:hypothetical protein SNE40_002199 [Patella caerulea]|uniref:FBXO47 ARM repeats region domain-containing protein n=1 Tax=Patella caerulea TaxID=87958 RepID=A0AAN8PZL9_PATCE
MATDVTFLPTKKPRRSTRLVVREIEDHKETIIRHGPLGYFNILPLELRFYLFNFLTIEDLSILTITSKIMRNLVEGYRITQPVTRHITPQPHNHVFKPPEHYELYFEKYEKLGLLMKRSTCLYATKDRLRVINDFLTKMMCCNSENDHDRENCISLTCFGKFFHTVIAGWDDTECLKAFEAICNHTSLLKNIKAVVTAKAGTYPKMELSMRLLIRRIFLDPCPSLMDKAFWLTRILKPWPMVTQARIIYLLYGASKDGDIFWFEMCENTPINTEQSLSHFGEIAECIQLLFNYKKEWSEDDIISVVDELTSSPDEWLAENVANLLLLCGDKITSKLLISKAINGRIIELCSVTTSFCLVCVKNSYSLSCVMIMVQNILQVMDNSKDRLLFINSMMDMFKELILDMHEFTESEEVHDSDLFYMVTALTEFTKRTIQMAFKNMLL